MLKTERIPSFVWHKRCLAVYNTVRHKNLSGGIPKMVLEKVKVILADQLEVEEDSITLDTHIQDDLGADSLDVVDMLMSIEDEFEIEIPDEEIDNIRTVGELVAYIEDHA